MELVSPLCFLYAFTSAPSSPTTRQYTLAGAFLLHYLNRALLSPLRTPSRSKAHLMVPLSAAVFNLVNGSLMGAFLSSPSAPVSTPRFYAGLALWAAGFMGNIVHDEILLNLRRRAKDKKDDGAPPGEHYAIPHGLLYRFVSYPNYLCEWLEWLGFALAAAPPPSLSSLSASLSSISSFSLSSVAHARPSLTPPYAFVLAEVLLMTPRALRGHAWYHERFGDAYPKERRAVVPWVL
ncbi:hypothetical protein DFH09DRAFT_1138312 [Mycena vulgaris]|nr:hypothetical protein DFH09DRAFT_1138312 [Mycena vulgaris]